jgi:membrane protein DedA with SNARE-associated domain
MGRVLWVVVLVLFSLLFVRDVAAAVVEPGWSIVGVVALVATVAIGIIVDRRAARRRKSRSRERDPNVHT